jgi:serine/threonine protein kinase
VYLAMEYVPGGDLRTLLNNSGILREDDAKFYIAEMFMAVHALHNLGFIHRQVLLVYNCAQQPLHLLSFRDLKPENFLIDGSGHIKLTDFGLSKGILSSKRVDSLRIKLEAAKEHKPTYRSIKERRSYRSIRKEDLSWAYSLVGSPDYMAPEILMVRPKIDSGTYSLTFLVIHRTRVMIFLWISGLLVVSFLNSCVGFHPLLLLPWKKYGSMCTIGGRSLKDPFMTEKTMSSISVIQPGISSPN